MQVQVDGSRSTAESWAEAHSASPQSLPVLSHAEQLAATRLALSSEAYSRSKYAIELTRQQLEQRASTLGRLVQEWLAEHGLSSEVRSVWLRTFEGKFRVDVQSHGSLQRVFVDEDLADDLLDRGSRETMDRLDTLLSASLLASQKAHAS